MTCKLIENEKTEFKSILNEKLEKVVVSFLNSKTGGDLYIGVANDGTVMGVENIDKVQLAITDRIKNNILPSCLGLFDVYSEELDEKMIIHIVISRGTEKPYYMKSFGLSPAGCFIRVGSGIKQMDIAMIDHLYASRTRNSLRNIVSPRYANHTFAQLKIYYEEHGFKLNETFIQNLDLYTSDGKLNYIAYLLADMNSVSIKVAKYAGEDKLNLLENEEYGFCSLIKATEKVLDKLDVENKTFTRITGNARRLERRMINKIALREAFINSIVHTDYTREVPPVVEIFSNRLVITSYGGLIEGLSKDEFYNGRSMPRNRELMRVFRDLEYVEHLGSGMNRILEVYDRGIFNLSNNFLQVIFPFEEDYEKDPDQVTMHDTMHVTMQVTMHVTMQVAKMIKAMDGTMSRLEIMQKMSLFNRDYFRLECLQPAIKESIIEMTIPDKPKSRFQKYRLSIKGIELKKSLISDKNYKISNENQDVKLVLSPVSDYTTMHVTMHVESLIQATVQFFSVVEMMEKLKLKNRPYFKLEYLKPALQCHVIEPMQANDSTNTVLKYYLTEKGLEIKKKLNREE